MTIYYRKHTEFPSLPLDLSEELIELAKLHQEENHPMEYWFRACEFENTNSVSFTTSDDKIVNTGGVGLYSLPEWLNSNIRDCYKNTNTELARIDKFLLQVVKDGKFVAPHIDPERTGGFLYMLQAGGNNVRTKWWIVKEEYNDLFRHKGHGIPYERLNEIEDHCLEENMWHWLNFGEIHSVENQETLRIALVHRNIGSVGHRSTAAHNSV